MNIEIKKSCIFLHDIHIHAFHGVAPQERKVGNDFRINIKLYFDMMKACNSDNLANTISYADVYEVIKEEMMKPSSLLENVCGRIIEELFDKFDRVKEIEISLAKRNPPMNADIEEAGVEITCRRDDLDNRSL